MLTRLVDWYWQWRSARDEARLRPWERRTWEAGLFPAYADWVGEFAVDADGHAWFVEHGGDWSARQPVEEIELQHVALAVAARRHAGARHLSPRRTPEDPTCASCGGVGRMPLPPSARYKILCQCGGLGWIRRDFRPWEERPDGLGDLAR